jgi:hypothetical protein
MVLIELTVVLIALLLTTVPAMGLYAIGSLLNRIADNFDDVTQNVRMITEHTQVIGQSVSHINRTGKLLVDELSLLHEGAERLVAKSATPVTTPPKPGHKLPRHAGTSRFIEFPSPHTRETLIPMNTLRTSGTLKFPD